MLTSFAALVMRDPMAGRRLAPIPPERARAARRLRHARGLLAQASAGSRCMHEMRPLPRRVPRERDGTAALAAGRGARAARGGQRRVRRCRRRRGPRVAAAEADAAGAGPLDVAVIGPDAVREETIWACMQCNACVEACPVGIEQAPIINQLRRRLVEDGRVPAKLQATLRAVAKSGNSFGENRRRRGRWTQELDFEVKDARAEPVDVLWFVGDYASFDPRSQQVPQRRSTPAPRRGRLRNPLRRRAQRWQRRAPRG